MSTKRDENGGMTKEQIAAAVQEHGGDPSMTLGDALGNLVATGKVKVANKNKGGSGSKVAVIAPAPKFSFKKPTLPTIHRILTAEERQKALEAERQRKVEEESALSEFKTQIGPWMPDLVASLRAFAAMTAEERELSANKEAEEQNRQALADIFNQVSGKARDVAVKCFAAPFVLTCPKRRRNVEDVLEKLVNYDLLIKSADQNRISKDGVRAYEVNYQLTKGFADDIEALEIMRDLRNLVRETRNVGREFYQTLEKAFEQKNDNPMSVDNLLALIYEELAEKKSGTVILDNPAHEERGITYQGGRILYGVNDNKLFVIDGLGGTQRVARNLAEMRTFLFLNQLREERVRFTDNMGDIARKSVALLHKLARIGIRTMREKTEKAAAEAKAAETKAKAEAEYAEERKAVLAMAGEVAVISNEEFLLNEKPGAIMPDNLPDPWVRKNKQEGGKPPVVTEFRHPENALVIRQDDGKIRVVCPDRLKTLFQGAQDACHPGEKFSNLEYPLGLMLRIMWGITKGAKDEADRKAKSETTEKTGDEAQ